MAVLPLHRHRDPLAVYHPPLKRAYARAVRREPWTVATRREMTVAAGWCSFAALVGAGVAVFPRLLVGVSAAVAVFAAGWAWCARLARRVLVDTVADYERRLDAEARRRGVLLAGGERLLVEQAVMVSVEAARVAEIAAVEPVRGGGR